MSLVNKMKLNEISKQAHEHAVKIGAYDCEECKGTGEFYQGAPCSPIQCTKCNGTGKTAEKNIIEKLKEEVGEFEEAINNSNFGQNYTLHRAIKYDVDSSFINRFENDVKNTVGDELSDIIITALAAAKELGIDIESHIISKIMYNQIREDHK